MFVDTVILPRLIINHLRQLTKQLYVNVKIWLGVIFKFLFLFKNE